MATGFRGAFVIAWAQTMLDGYPAQGQFHLSEGMTWRWHGRAMPLAGEGGALLLHDSVEHAELRGTGGAQADAAPRTQRRRNCRR